MRWRSKLQYLAMQGVRWAGAPGTSLPCFGKILASHTDRPWTSIAFVDGLSLTVETYHHYNPTFYTRSDYPVSNDCWGLERLAERRTRMAVKRLVVRGRAGGPPAVAKDAQLARRHPLLCSQMTDLVYDDGEPRQPASLLMFTSEGEWRACLHDRDAGAHLWASGDTLEQCLSTLEKRLGEDDPGWRAKNENGTTGKRKK